MLASAASFVWESFVLKPQVHVTDMLMAHGRSLCCHGAGPVLVIPSSPIAIVEGVAFNLSLPLLVGPCNPVGVTLVPVGSTGGLLSFLPGPTAILFASSTFLNVTVHAAMDGVADGVARMRHVDLVFEGDAPGVTGGEVRSLFAALDCYSHECAATMQLLTLMVCRAATTTHEHTHVCVFGASGSRFDALPRN